VRGSRVRCGERRVRTVRRVGRVGELEAVMLRCFYHGVETLFCAVLYERANYSQDSSFGVVLAVKAWVHYCTVLGAAEELYGRARSRRLCEV